MKPRLVALLVLGVVAVSVSAPLIRLADAPPLAIAFYRNAIAALLLLPIALARGRAELRSLTPRQLGGLALAGTFLALHFATFIPAVTLTTVAASTVLVNTQPVWAAIGARIAFGDGCAPGRWPASRSPSPARPSSPVATSADRRARSSATCSPSSAR